MLLLRAFVCLAVVASPALASRMILVSPWNRCPETNSLNLRVKLGRSPLDPNNTDPL